MNEYCFIVKPVIQKWGADRGRPSGMGHRDTPTLTPTYLYYESATPISNDRIRTSPVRHEAKTDHHTDLPRLCYCHMYVASSYSKGLFL